MSDHPSASAGAGRVVVGIDGSEQSLRALDRAAQEAERRGAELEMLYATDRPAPSREPGRGPADEPAFERFAAAAAETVDAAGQRAEARAPGLRTVPTVVTAGGAADALVRASRAAALTVVGTRGGGGFAGLLVGSVALRVAAHCRSPLLAVGALGEDVAAVRGAVLVALRGGGSDGGDGDGEDEGEGEEVGGRTTAPADDEGAALRFGFEEAARRGCELRVLHVWPRHRLSPAKEAERVRALAGRLVREAVAPYRARHPGVRVSEGEQAGGAAAALVEASRAADVIVLAAGRRAGRRLGLQLGPVTHAVLHHAHCPVALLPTG